MKLDYRSVARTARTHAEQELAAKSDARIRYAALELRTAMEALVYERLLLYETELPEAELATWQPKRVFDVLLELDPNADQSSSLAMAEESSPGVQAGPFKHMGNERVISMKDLKKYYDRLGSYLHAPTVQQLRGGPSITPEQMRQRCQEVLGIIDGILSSPIWSVDFKTVSKMACAECAAAIVCRMPHKTDQGRIVNCTRCKASYRVEPEEEMQVTWHPLQETLKCGGQDCTGTCVVWQREMEPGMHWLCKTCGGRNGFAIGIAYHLPQALADGDRKPQPPSKP